MKRKSYFAYWEEGDISPINADQRLEIGKIKSDFVMKFKIMNFKKGDRITIDPYFRHIRIGEGDSLLKENDVIFKWGPWEFSHIKNWLIKYLNACRFVEVYHYQMRAPIGAIEFIKQ